MILLWWNMILSFQKVEICTLCMIYELLILMVSTPIIIWNFHWYNEIYNLGIDTSPRIRASSALSQILGLCNHVYFRREVIWQLVMVGWIPHENYTGSPMARGSKEGCFLLPEKRPQSSIFGPQNPVKYWGEKCLTTNVWHCETVLIYFESLHYFIAHSKDDYPRVQFILMVIERYKM